MSPAQQVAHERGLLQVSSFAPDERVVSRSGTADGSSPSRVPVQDRLSSGAPLLGLCRYARRCATRRADQASASLRWSRPPLERAWGSTSITAPSRSSRTGPQPLLAAALPRRCGPSAFALVVGVASSRCKARLALTRASRCTSSRSARWACPRHGPDLDQLARRRG